MASRSETPESVSCAPPDPLLAFSTISFIAARWSTDSSSVLSFTRTSGVSEIPFDCGATGATRRPFFLNAKIPNPPNTPSANKTPAPHIRLSCQSTTERSILGSAFFATETFSEIYSHAWLTLSGAALTAGATFCSIGAAFCSTGATLCATGAGAFKAGVFADISCGAGVTTPSCGNAASTA